MSQPQGMVLEEGMEIAGSAGRCSQAGGAAIDRTPADAVPMLIEIVTAGRALSRHPAGLIDLRDKQFAGRICCGMQGQSMLERAVGASGVRRRAAATEKPPPAVTGYSQMNSDLTRAH
ncbi:MAG: hypothetical protein E5Y30_01685 [Mesorhizobium sp.]|nr:MAG: hypothetical protein E5Y30_01685 [Mesorhizobium sp.]